MKKNCLPIFFVCFVVIVLPSLAFGQSAKEAVMALKKLESRVDTGISYRDYAPALGEAKFPAKLFLESNESRDNPELRDAIEKSIEHYNNAHALWKYEVSQQVSSPRLYEKYDREIFYQVLKIYPDAPKISAGEMRYSDVISFIWKRASQATSIAYDLLTKSQLKETSIKTETETLRKENETLKRDFAEIKDSNEKLNKENVELKQEIDNLKIEMEKIKTKARKK